MKTLTKAQSEAIVSEVQDRLRDLQGPDILPRRLESSWEKLKSRISEYRKREAEEEKLREKLDEFEEENKDIKNELRNYISAFEDRNELSVEWEYLDDDEEPRVVFPVRDHKEKIARQIQILSIDKKGPLTADDLIEAIVNKMTKTGFVNKPETI